MAVFYITRSDLGPGRRDRLLSARNGPSTPPHESSTILRRSDRYFLRYDAGKLVVQIRELELSPEDVVLAAQNEQSAYAVIFRLTSANRERRANATDRP